MAREKHGDKYDYSLVEYKNRESKVKIICPKHGIFEQNAQSHYQKGHGCLRCSKLSYEDFLKRARTIHGNLFNYSLLDYKGTRQRIKVACQNGHIFSIRADNHLAGGGCPKCKESSLETNMKAILIRNKIHYNHQKKFKTCYNPETDKALIFDFYLPNYKTLIEINGPAHYIKNFYKSSNDNFSNRVKRDLIKRRWCKNNNYNFLVIPYTRTKNMEEILLGFIEKKSCLCQQSHQMEVPSLT